MPGSRDSRAALSNLSKEAITILAFKGVLKIKILLN